MKKLPIKTILEDLMYEIEIGAMRFGQDFVKSVNAHYKKHGEITSAQEEPLRKIYKAHMEG